MPVLPLQPMESVYKSGYYEDVTPVENITDANTIIIPPPVRHPSQKMMYLLRPQTLLNTVLFTVAK